MLLRECNILVISFSIHLQLCWVWCMCTGPTWTCSRLWSIWLL